VADILDEVLNDAKDEKKIVFFRKIFPLIIASTIIVAIAMAGYNWYQARIDAHNQEVGDLSVDLISGEYGEKKLIDESLNKLVKDGDNRQVELAEIQIVSGLIESGDKSGALMKLSLIIANKDYYDITTSFARLLWLNIILDESNISDEQQMKARNYMQHFKEADQVFFVNATLLKALFYKKNNQNDLAAEYANVILGMNNASIMLKEQAKAVLSSL